MNRTIPPTMKFAVGIMLFLALAVNAARAEFLLQPSLIVSEEYNDNIDLQTENLQQQDYITRVAPSLTLHYQTPFWLWDGVYTPEYRYYDTHHDNTETTHTSHVRNLTELIRTFFFFEGIDDYRRVSLDVANDYTRQSASARQTDQHTLTLHPYIVLRPASNSTLQYGHMLIDTRFTTGGGINRTDNIDYIESSTAVTSSLTATVGVRHTREENDLEDFDQTTVYGGARYAYGALSSLYGRAGKSWFEYDTSGRATRYDWTGGLNHRISEYSFTLESGVTYLQDPLRVATREDAYRASVARETERSTLSASAGLREFRNAATNELLTITRDALGSVVYRFTTRTTGAVRTGYQDIKDRATSSHTYLSLSSLRFDYRFSETTTIALEYSYLRSYAPVIAENNYTNNRGIVQITMLF